MNRTRIIILPILAAIVVLLFGWSTISAQTIERLTNQMQGGMGLPSGTQIQLTLTEEDATAYAEEYLESHKDELKDLMKKNFGIALDVSDPKITFQPDLVMLSVRAGFGFLKIRPSASAIVMWEDGLQVTVVSVDVPIVSIDPDSVTSYIQEPIQSMLDDIEENYEITDVRIEDGYAVVEAITR